MQTLIQVFCKGNTTSLRRQIATDSSLEEYSMYVEKHKDNARSSGWLKLKSHDLKGSLNIEWDAKSKLLSVRVVNKRLGKPDKISGEFIKYILDKHFKLIQCINIIPIDSDR